MDQRIEIPLTTDRKSNTRFFGKVLPKGMWYPVLLSLTGVLIAWLTASYGVLPGVFMIILLVAIPLVYSVIQYPRFGVTILLVMAYLLMWFVKMGINFPLGTLMDALQLLLLIGLMIKIKYHPVKNLYKNPVTLLILLWIGYNVIQVGNPSAESRAAWLYTIRTVAIVMVTYFIFTYHFLSVSFLKFVVKLWLGLSVFAALYAMWQEYVDFLPFEKKILYDPLVQSLLFIDGRWRKFSIFADPVTYSYNMVASFLLCIGLLTGQFSRKKKIILGVLAFLFIYVMLFSGTRGAYVLPPAGLGLLAVMRMNRKVFIATLCTVVILVTLIFIPTSNYTLFRFQSAFKPSDDASFNVRKNNQKRIQPFILTHPMGGGLGATGVWGVRFAPNSFLANFPPDSGYVRVAVELGWIGLFLFCTLLFCTLRMGINHYYAIRDPFLKSLCLAITIIVFAWSVGNYPQEAFVQFPTNTYIYLCMAIITVVRPLDKALQAKAKTQPGSPAHS